MKQKTGSENFYIRAPYKDAFDIECPQEPVEGKMYTYRCKHCKVLTTDLNGLLENHKPDCEYRLQRTAHRS